MKIFLCWSGPVSKSIATSLRHWLPRLNPKLDPFMSDEDIQKGTYWNTVLKSQLEEIKVGIICLTPENINAPWLHFETGAIFKGKDGSRVCPLLFKLKKSFVNLPLSNFQLTELEKKDFERLLVGTINENSGDDKIREDILKDNFEKYWPDIEKDLIKIEKESKNVKEPEPRSEKDILSEILEIVRDMNRRYLIEVAEARSGVHWPEPESDRSLTFEEMRNKALHGNPFEKDKNSQLLFKVLSINKNKKYKLKLEKTHFDEMKKHDLEKLGFKFEAEKDPEYIKQGKYRCINNDTETRLIDESTVDGLIFKYGQDVRNDGDTVYINP